jgi:hypothetical protein
LKDLGDYDAAKVFLLKALEISKKHFGEDHANYGNIYENLAEVFEKMG